MEDSKQYSIQDIENIKQQIELYRDTINSLRTGNSVEVKDETVNVKKEEYGERVKNITVQIESINQTVEVLSQDISAIMSLLKSGEVNDLIESINTLVDLHDSINIPNENEKSDIDTGTIHTESLASPSTIPTSTLPLSYKQFQNFFNSANDIQEITARPEYVENISTENNQERQQNIGRRSFPSIGANSTQKNNGQYRSFHSKPTNTLNRVVMKQATPLKVNINPSISFTQYDIQPEENATVIEPLDIVQNEAIIDEIEDTAEVIVEDIEEIIVEDADEVIEECTDEVIEEDIDEVIVEDKVEIVNEIVDETIVKEQSENKTKSRELFSFFNFFLKKS